MKNTKPHLYLKLINFPYICLLCSIYVLSVIPINGHNKDSLKKYDEKLTYLPESVIGLIKTLGRNDFNLKNQNTDLLEVEVALETDYELYVAFDENIDHMISYLEGLFGTVSQIYEQEMQIKLTVTYVHVWDKPDMPYTGTSTGIVLGEFKDYWNEKMQYISRDLAYYITPYSSLDGTSRVYTNGFQNTAQAYGIIQVAGFYAQLPVFTEDVATVSHEMGHSFGSPHTHNCNWPGGPIDLCQTVEGGSCYSGQAISSFGTIMSYCTNRRLSFHPLVRELIRTQVEAASNVTIIDKAPQSPVLIKPIHVAQNVSTSQVFDWNSVSGANIYNIQIDASPDFSNPLISFSTNISRFQWSGLDESTQFYWRVSASNEFGDSPWSEIWNFTTQTEGVPATPIPISPAQGDIDVKEETTFTWQPSTGAESYRFQVSGQWLSSRNSHVIIDEEVTDTFFNAESYFIYGEHSWRVQAINVKGESPWSTYNCFWMASIPDLLFPYQNDLSAPITCPFSWRVPVYAENSWIQISKSPSFEDLVVDQDGILYPTPWGRNRPRFFMADLEPNTSYFWRVNQHYSDSVNSPVLSGWSEAKSFTTASETEKQPNYYNTYTKDLKSDLINCITIDNHQNIWICTSEGGLASFDGTKWSNYDFQSSGGILGNSFMTSTFDPQENIIWVACVVIGFFRPATYLYKFDGVQWQVFSSHTSDLPFEEIYSMAVDADHNLWLATLGGLVKYNGSEWIVYNTSNSGLPSNYLTKLFIDTNGIIWIGSEDAGLVRFDGEKWTVYNTANSALPNDRIRDILADDHGTLWLALGEDGIVSFDGNKWSIDKTISPVIFISKDNEGIVWIGGYGELAWYNGETWIRYYGPKIYSSGEVMDFEIDANGQFWIGYYGTGVVSFDPKEFGITSIEEEEYSVDPFAESVRISPNPVKDYLSIQINKSGNFEIEIISINGQIIQVDSYYEGTHQIDLSTLQTGVYLIRVRSDDHLITKKLIKL